MKKKTVVRWITLVVICGTVTIGCGKLKMSSVKMPKFRFVTTENLHSISCIGKNIWVSGGYGTIIDSSDGGVKWKKQKTGVEELLCCITFATEKKGWVGGVKGVMLHTEDGGKTWTKQETSTENNFMDIFFLNDKKGWVVGE